MSGAGHLDFETLNLYLDGELSPPVCQETEVHLAACPACRQELERLRALFTALEAWPETEPARDFAGAVVAQLRGGRAAARRLQALLVLQAAVALALLAWGWSLAVPWLDTLGRDLGARALGWLAAAGTTFQAWQQGLVADLGPRLLAAWEQAVSVPNLPLPDQPATFWAAVLAGALALWLAGNGLLLGRGARGRDGGHR